MSVHLIQQFYARIDKIIQYGGSRNERVLREAFEDLLSAYAAGKNLLLVSEVDLPVGAGRFVVPDGTLKDALRQDWGYWEAKDEKDDLDAEIKVKFSKGYPRSNILFQDAATAVLFQNGQETGRAKIEDPDALDALLTRFVGYEPSEVTAFHRAIEEFNADVPALANELRAIIDEQVAANANFAKALGEFLDLCKHAINPNVELADAREMIIQHVLTEDVFMTIFDEPQFHEENAVARKLHEVVATFYHGAVRHSVHGRISKFYETINARASQIHNHHEKQKFLKALYENFYRAYNPKAADRLGIVYTPDEIVRFMIAAADFLTHRHFNRTLGSPGVEILDPAVGTGTFITELIECLPPKQLPHKYRDELHCNEVAILPYYIANLNIEYTYKQRTGEYAPFENLCFVDTLDNTGFKRANKQQMDFFGLVDQNIERIERQNERKISVIIGNPPYNANQLNENENNKNRAYPAIDKRIKETYIKYSTAQKTKLYDMYARFLRWASDRLDQNGIVAFVSNNSFLDARTYDGFREVVEREFNTIYVIDLKGNARTSGERRRREGGNIFSDQIRVGVAIYFLVRKEKEKGCRIFYTTVPDYAHAQEKKAFLRENPFNEIQFDTIHPDKSHNWLNQAENDWEDLIPIASKEAKAAKGAAEVKAIFKQHALGVSTNRDEWVLDINPLALAEKVRFLIEAFRRQARKAAKTTRIPDPANDLDYSIKWSDTLKRNLVQGAKIEFDSSLVTSMHYRPFVSLAYYSDKIFSDRLTANHYEIFGPTLKNQNSVIAVSGQSTARSFCVLASRSLIDLHFIGDSQSLPLYRYAESNEQNDNITDWALEQFRTHYKDTRISKEEIFHYVYAVLHHPAYRTKYALNLKREFPRIPFYADFRKWVKWGKALMELHLNYEEATPYRLKREERKPKDVPLVAPRLLARKTDSAIEVDTLTTLRGVPPEAWEYRLGTYSALEWVLERYKERKPKDPTIAAKFNTYRFADHKEAVIDLLRRVCTVSVETMKIVAQMPETS